MSMDCEIIHSPSHRKSSHTRNLPHPLRMVRGNLNRGQSGNFQIPHSLDSRNNYIRNTSSLFSFYLVVSTPKRINTSTIHAKANLPILSGIKSQISGYNSFTPESNI